MPEDGAQDRAGGRAIGVSAGGDARDDNALGVDHFAHDAAGAVGGAREEGREAELFGGDFLQVAEEDVGGGVAAGERDAEPADDRREEREPPTGAREREAHRGVGAAVFRSEAERHHRRNREQRDAHAPQGLAINAQGAAEADAQGECRGDAGQQQRGARRGEEIQFEHRGVGRGLRCDRRHLDHGVVELGHGDLRRIPRIEQALDLGHTPGEDEGGEKNPR